MASLSASLRARKGPLDWRFVGRACLIALFVVVDIEFVQVAVVGGNLGSDAVVYRHAAIAWLNGGDPWRTPVDGITFGSTPPTLLTMLPFIPLGDWASSILWPLIDAVTAVWLCRRLGKPLWWLAFPPFWDATWYGNSNVVVVALLVAGGPVADTVAVFLKPYAVLPLLGMHRWRSVALAGIALAATAFVLPWGRFIAELPAIAAATNEQANAHLIVWTVPFVLVALATLGPAAAGWLAVPVLTPGTQLHYSLFALPVVDGLLAAFLVLPVSGLAALGAVVAAIRHAWSGHSGRPR